MVQPVGGGGPIPPWINPLDDPVRDAPVSVHNRELFFLQIHWGDGALAPLPEAHQQLRAEAFQSHVKALDNHGKGEGIWGKLAKVFAFFFFFQINSGRIKRRFS